jgi:type IV pilus assembly protein PilN
MIKINLASSSSRFRSPLSGGTLDGNLNEKQLQTQGAIKLALLLIGPLALWLWQSNVIIPEKTVALQQKQKLLAELTQKNAQAASAVAEMKSFEVDESRLKEQIGVIDSLRKDRMREVRILDVVQREMPEHMWLNKVELKSGRMSISGMAGADSDITQLMDTLNRSGILKDVNLISTNEQMIEGNVLKEFSIDCAFPKPESKSPSTPSAGGKG